MQYEIFSNDRNVIEKFSGWTSLEALVCHFAKNDYEVAIGKFYAKTTGIQICFKNPDINESKKNSEGSTFIDLPESEIKKVDFKTIDLELKNGSGPLSQQSVKQSLKRRNAKLKIKYDRKLQAAVGPANAFIKLVLSYAALPLSTVLVTQEYLSNGYEYRDYIQLELRFIDRNSEACLQEFVLFNPDELDNYLKEQGLQACFEKCKTEEATASSLLN